MAGENCIRVPREEAERFGWIPKVISDKLRDLKDKYASTSSGNRRLPDEDTADLKPLMDYQDRHHGIGNEVEGIKTLLRSYFEKDRLKGQTAADALYVREASEYQANGGKIGREPTSSEDAANLGQHYAELNNINRFREEATQAGVIGKQTNPNFKGIRGRAYRELQVRGNPGEQYGILPHLRGAHEDVFSALSRDEKPWGALDPLRRLRSMSTAAIMWTPAFHTVNIGSRWLVPMLARMDNLHPAGIRRTLSAFKQAARDFTDPVAQRKMGEEGLITLGPHGWKESDTGQIRSLFYKLPGAEKVLAPILGAVDKAMPSTINYMGYVAYHLARQDYIKKGVRPEVAGVMAARKTSILMGTIAKDSLTRGWRHFADAALFSTRYTTTTLQLFSRALTKDEALRRRLASMGVRPDELARAVDLHKGEFQKLLVKDYLAMLAFANVMNYMFTGLYNVPDKNGKKGAHYIWDNYGTNWYKNWVNVKAIGGVDPETGKPILVGNPFRSTRDIAELLTGWLAVASGTENAQTLGQNYLNKTNQFWQVFLDLGKGTDWSGRTLNQPTTAETLGSYAGDVAERTTPLPDVRPTLVAAITRMEGGNPEVWKDVVASMDKADATKLVIRALGGQTSTGERYGEPRSEAYAAQERVQSWLSNPVIRKELEKGDPLMHQTAIQHLAAAGIVGSAAEKMIQRAIRSSAGTSPLSKSVRVYESQQGNE